MIRQDDGRPRGRVDSQKAGPGAVRMAPAVGVGHKTGRARRAGHLLQFVQVATQCLVPLRDAQASVLKGLLAHRGQGQLAGRCEQNPFHAAAAVPAAGVFHGLLAHAGLVHAATQHPVTPEHIVQQAVLLGKAGSASRHQFPRP